jgi:hypothetical protein
MILHFYIEPPLIYLSLGNNLILNNQMLNLTYGNTYELTCVARNSKPSVELAIQADDLYLNTFSNQIFSITSQSTECDSNSMCTTGLIFNISINDARLLFIKRITCQAFNNTIPYDLNAANSISVTVNAPQGIIYSYSHQLSS